MRQDDEGDLDPTVSTAEKILHGAHFTPRGIQLGRVCYNIM